jgi:hypothetical protein
LPSRDDENTKKFVNCLKNRIEGGPKAKEGRASITLKEKERKRKKQIKNKKR